MNDIVSTTAIAHSPALWQLYDVIAGGASARDTATGRIRMRRSVCCGRPASARCLFRLPKAEAEARCATLSKKRSTSPRRIATWHIFPQPFYLRGALSFRSSDKRREGWRRTVLDGGIVGLATTELDRPRMGGAYPMKTTLVPDADSFRLQGPNTTAPAVCMPI
jgi:hypothetical protein